MEEEGDIGSTVALPARDVGGGAWQLYVSN